MTERPADTDWTRVGPEEPDFKLYCNSLVPEVIDEALWTQMPAAMRKFIRNELRIKGPKP